MPTTGTENAAVLWKAAHEHGKPMSEAEARKATGLGAGTINRLLRLLAAQGYMQRHEATDTDVTRYTPLRTIDEVRVVFCRRTHGSGVPKPGHRDSDPLSHFKAGMPRVSSVWELGARL
jgi:hypothetical protein